MQSICTLFMRKCRKLVLKKSWSKSQARLFGARESNKPYGNKEWRACPTKSPFTTPPSSRSKQRVKREWKIWWVALLFQTPPRHSLLFRYTIPNLQNRTHFHPWPNEYLGTRNYPDCTQWKKRTGYCQPMYHDFQTYHTFTFGLGRRKDRSCRNR